MSSSENDGKMKITVSINFGAGVTMRKVAYTDGPGELSIPLDQFELVDAEEQEKDE